MAIKVDGVEIQGESERDVDRTNAAGKASSVQFIHFPMTREVVEKFKKPGAEVQVAIRHPNYGHIALMPERVRAALAADLD